MRTRQHPTNALRMARRSTGLGREDSSSHTDTHTHTQTNTNTNTNTYTLTQTQIYSTTKAVAALRDASRDRAVGATAPEFKPLLASAPAATLPVLSFAHLRQEERQHQHHRSHGRQQQPDDCHDVVAEAYQTIGSKNQRTPSHSAPSNGLSKPDTALIDVRR